MSDREPRWKQISHKKHKQRDQSFKSKSSRYTPKRSHHSEDEQSGIRVIALNISQHSIEDHHDRKLAKSAINYAPSESGPKRLSDANYKATDSLSGSKGRSSLHRKNVVITKGGIKMTMPEMVEVDANTDAQTQFKQYMFFIESVQRKFQNEKLEIQNLLMSQYEQIKEVKNKIIDAYAKKQADFKDKSLKKVITNRLTEKRKPESKSFGKVISEKKLQKTRENLIHRKEETAHHSEEKRGQSAGSWASNKFDKIFTTLNQMKMNLNDCKKLRETKSPGKQKPKQMEGKGNLVNTNQLKVKSKKTHE